MFFRKEKKNKGFTLVETLIAITILMVSIVAPLSLASKGIEAAALAKQEIIASYLAQDAYEWVRNKMSSNKMIHPSYADGGLMKGLKDDCYDSNSCIVDTTDNSIEVYNNQRLYFHENTGIYNHDSAGGTKTMYERYVNLDSEEYHTTGTTYDEIMIKVIVKWKLPYGPLQTYELKGNITNW